MTYIIIYLKGRVREKGTGEAGGGGRKRERRREAERESSHIYFSNAPTARVQPH